MFTKGRFQNFAIGFLAIAIGVTTYLYLSSLNTRANSDARNVGAYVAIADIPAGTSWRSMIEDGQIALKQFPAASISSQSLSSEGELSSGLISNAAINNGQLILKPMFAPAKSFASGLKIPGGDLAISVSIDDVSRVANFVVPGSRVIIFSTGADSKRGESSTRVLVPDALVLAIGSFVGTPSIGSQVPSSPLVTLAVNPLEANQIIHASQTSKLSFALAHANDPRTISLPNSAISSSTLFGQG